MKGDVPERGASFVGQAGGELHIDAVRPEAIAHRALDPPRGVRGRMVDRRFAGSVGEEKAAVLPGGEHRAGGVGRRAVHDVLEVEADGVVPVEVVVRVAQMAQRGKAAPLAVGVRLVVEEEAPEGAAAQSNRRGHVAVSPILNFIDPLHLFGPQGLAPSDSGRGPIRIHAAGVWRRRVDGSRLAPESPRPPSHRPPPGSSLSVPSRPPALWGLARSAPS